MTFTFSLDNIAQAADQCWKIIDNRNVVAFHGQMGAGKTTLINALCRTKQVSSAVSSPTFSIINEYTYPGGVLYHIDLYRLDREEEAFRAGVEDCLYSGNICLVEWPERAAALFPPDAVNVFIEVVDAESRRITIRET